MAGTIRVWLYWHDHDGCVSMESGLDGRNNPHPKWPVSGVSCVSMESGLDGRNNQQLLPRLFGQ